MINDKFQASMIMADFLKREVVTLTSASDLDSIADWAMQKSEVVIKPRVGAQGIGVEFISTVMDRFELIQLFKDKLKSGDQIIEEVIEQHPQMKELHSDSVNTIRIQSIIHKGKVGILGAVLRIGCGGRIDNMSSGGLAAAVDLESGSVISKAYYKDITKPSGLSEHPLTGIQIPGFKIPCWPEVLGLVQEMATMVPMIRTVGWDIAISPNGPVLVEFNREWMPDTFQIPYNRGRLLDLLPYMPPSCLYPVHHKYLKSVGIDPVATKAE